MSFELTYRKSVQTKADAYRSESKWMGFFFRVSQAENIHAKPYLFKPPDFCVLNWISFFRRLVRSLLVRIAII